MNNNVVWDPSVPFFLKSVDKDEYLPATSDVVIIGSGIVGASAAYFLSKAGYRVAVIEKGYVGAEQSSRNWGWCRQQNRDHRELPLIKRSLELWNNFNGELGADTGFRRSGLLYVTDNEEQLDSWRGWVEMAKEYGVHSRVLSASETRELAPNFSRNTIGGVSSPTDGYAEPSLATPVIAAAARRLGATFHQKCAARGMEITNGRVASVVTERGVIKADAVLCAAGAWASMFCKWHDVHFPQSGANSTTFSTTPATPVITGGFSTPEFTVRPRLDGGYTVAVRTSAMLDVTPQSLLFARDFLPMLRARRDIHLKLRFGRSFFEGPGAISNWGLDSISPFEKTRVLNPPPDSKIVNAGLKALVEAYPELRGIGVAEKWGGCIDSTPDGIPVISAVPAIEGFYIAAGFSGHGFGIGPAAGELAAQIVSGTTPKVEIGAFDFSRFGKGRRVEEVAAF